MALSELTSRAAVLKAIHEFDDVGQAAFLTRYGFQQARSYVVVHEGREYDSKAIAGSAFGYQFPQRGALPARAFSGGDRTVARVLGAMGFVVRAGSPVTTVPPQRWALLARPSRYRVLDAVAHVDVDHWLSRGKDLRPGDTVVIWQATDAEGRRGVVALGDVIGSPVRATNVGNPYWVNAADGDLEEERVAIRYRRIPRPLWADDSDAGRFVADLSVARARGGTVFRVREEQWRRLEALTGGPPPAADAVEAEDTLRRPGGRARGQGFGLSHEERRAVESWAMQRAIAYLATRWQSVDDVSARCSYDLLCRTGDVELRVEVKGTTSRGEQIVLTRREVDEAGMPGYALFVCSDIELHRDTDPVTATGGVCRVLHAWDGARHQFTPLAYVVTLDWSDGEVVDEGPR